MIYSGSPTLDYFSGKPKKLKISLNDVVTLDDIIKELANTNDVVVATANVVNRLAETGANYARYICPKDTYELAGSITSETRVSGTKVTGTITAGSDHAAYVEFGVGVVGQGTYPGDDSGWQYNVPSEFKDETGGWWWNNTYTHGNVANPFMYNTAKYIEEHSKEILKK